MTTFLQTEELQVYLLSSLFLRELKQSFEESEYQGLVRP